MPTVKTIPLDQLKPGMFVVGMDQPWYRTPFLFNKRLIRHQEDIALLRQHGVKEVTIDPEKGLDLEEEALENRPPPASREQAPTQTPIITAADEPAQASKQQQASAAQATYAEATHSMNRLLDTLEQGGSYETAALNHIIDSVFAQVLDDSVSMLTLLYVQKMQRFDRTLASHALDVCILSLIVAHASAIAENELQALGAGALLHDIGYIRLPRNLYRKHQDLTDNEQALMQQHPRLGLAILREANETRDTVTRIVGEHHARGDGSGFPQQLAGNALSPLAQLVGLVDHYDNLTSRRGGRPALLPHDAIREVFRLGDTGQFPKEMVEVLIRSLGVYPIGSLVLLNTKEQAIVVDVNPQQRLKPVVKVITGPKGETYLTPIPVDLAAQADDAAPRTIAKVLNPLDERVNMSMLFEGINPETIL